MDTSIEINSDLAWLGLMQERTHFCVNSRISRVTQGENALESPVPVSGGKLPGTRE